MLRLTGRLLVAFAVFVVCSPSLAFGAEEHWLADRTGLSVADLLNLALVIMTAGPVLGNALAHFFTRIGWLRGAARVARWTPFATQAASAALRAPTLGQAARAVILEAKKDEALDGPISTAAAHLKDFVEDDLMPILEAADPPKAPKEPGAKLPPGMGGILIVIATLVGYAGLVAALGGCGGALEELADDSAKGLTAGAELSNVCAEAMDERLDLRTGKAAPCAPDDAKCIAEAEAESKEADAAINALRELFCKYAPAGVCS